MVKITQVKSSIGQSKKQKATLITLGIKGIGKSATIDMDNPALKGMVKKISHLVTIEEV